MRRICKKNSICICISIFFIIGICGSLHLAIGFPADRVPVQADCMEEGRRESPDALDLGARIFSSGLFDRLDDFRLASGEKKTSQNLLRCIRGLQWFLFAAAAFLYLGKLLFRRVYFGERQIPVFCMADFIHRTDGKKKTCFESRGEIKTGGYKNGNRYKIQSLINR